MTCACGCGALVKAGKRWKHGHNEAFAKRRRKGGAQRQNGLMARRGLQKLGLERREP